MRYGIYHKPSDVAAWADISSLVSLKDADYSITLGQSPLKFSIPVKDIDAEVSIADGDLIAICEDTTRFEIVDKLVVGMVTNPGKTIPAPHPSNVWTPDFKLECSEFDFSGYDVKDYSYANTLLSVILSDIVSNTNELLGGVVNGVTIDKYELLTSDITIDSFQDENLTDREALTKLCEQNNLFWVLEWFSSPDTTNTLKLAARIKIFDRSGLTPSNDWSLEGINDTNLKRGTFLNPEYSGDSSQDEYLIGEKQFEFDTDKDIIKNIIIITANVVDDSAFDNSIGTLERYVTKALPNTDTYTLPYPASGVKYAGFLVPGIVTADSVPTTTAFSVAQLMADSVSVGDFVRVYDISGDVENFREVTNVTGQVITVTPALAFTPATNDVVEVVMQDWVTIYDENLNEDDYSSTGIAVNATQDKECQIRWLARSAPPPGVDFIIYYYRAIPKKKRLIHPGSIRKYGPRKLERKIDGYFTTEQYNKLCRSLEIPEPNYTCSFLTCRRLLPGENVSISITGFTSDNFRATDVTCRFLGVQFNNRNHREYKISCSTLKENADEILKRLTKAIPKVRPSGPKNPTIRVDEKVSTSESISFIKTDATYSEKILFSSNRSGTYQLYMMDTDGSNVLRLTNNAFNDRHPFVNQAGTKVTFHSDRPGSNDIYIADITISGITNETRLTNDGNTYENPTFNPDGTKIFFNTTAAAADIYSMNIDGTSLTNIINEVGTSVANPHCGTSKVYYTSFLGGATLADIYQANPGGTGKAAVLTGGTDDQRPKLNLAETSIVFQRVVLTRNHIYKMTSAGGSVTMLTNPTTYSDRQAFWSYDGTEIVFSSDRVGNFEIYKMTSAGASPTRLTTDGGIDEFPFWGKIYDG
jgi:Tol biopolymer transport system component